MFNIGEPEITKLLTNRREYDSGFCAARSFDLPSAFLKFAISAAGDGEEMIQPGEQVVFVGSNRPSPLQRGSSKLM